MLLQKPLTTNDVVSIKLVSGEELIARFQSESDTHLVVSKVSAVGANQNGMGLMPWIVSANTDELKLNKQTVVAYAPTEKEIASKFTEMTSSIKLV